MTIYKGYWRAKVDQQFEVEADSLEEAKSLIEQEMEPRNVVELHDFEYEIEDES